MSSNQSEMDNEEVKKHDNEKLEFKFTEKHWIPPTINTTNVSHHNLPKPAALTRFKRRRNYYNYNCSSIPLHKLEGEEMESKMQSIFNTVTLQNVNNLSISIKKFNLYNINNLIYCVHFIVDQALCVSSYSSAYAKLCVAIRKRKAPCGFNQNKVVSTISFKEVIIRKCQDVLHMANIEIEEIQKDKKTNEKIENNQYQQPNHNIMLIREKLLANCKFILELYNVQILTPEDIINILDIMFEKVYEEFIECACHIILGIGEKLFHKYDITAKFNRIKEIIANRHVPSTSKEIHGLVKSISDNINKWKLHPTITKKNKNKK